MPEIDGAKLITSAYLFGGAGIAFTTLPFLGVIVAGIVRGNNGNHNTTKGGDILTIVGWAFIIHFIISMLFMGVILILDEFNLDSPNYYTSTVFPIFWADTQAQVFSLAGVTTSDTEAELAYTTLNFLQTGVRLFLTFLPLVLIFLAAVYGFILTRKDSYNANFISVVAFTAISFISIGLLYLLWAKVSSYALFIPGGADLVTMIGDIWKSLIVN